jgi:hypothetical protein
LTDFPSIGVIQRTQKKKKVCNPGNCECGSGTPTNKRIAIGILKSFEQNFFSFRYDRQRRTLRKHKINVQLGRFFEMTKFSSKVEKKKDKNNRESAEDMWMEHVEMGGNNWHGQRRCNYFTSRD